MEDVWTVVSQCPAQPVESDARTRYWLIEIAKRYAPSSRAADMRLGPRDDLEAREFHEEVAELAAELWESND